MNDSTEPTLETAAHLLPILERLRAREPLFHRPELGTTRAAFEAQITDDFWEVGASGRRYSREFVLATVETRWSEPHADPWHTSGFHLRELGPDTYALTYTLQQESRVTRRLTLWRREEESFKALFHQGTIVA
jgi:hypothetical protein